MTLAFAWQSPSHLSSAQWHGFGHLAWKTPVRDVRDVFPSDQVVVESTDGAWWKLLLPTGWVTGYDGPVDPSPPPLQEWARGRIPSPLSTANAPGEATILRAGLVALPPELISMIARLIMPNQQRHEPPVQVSGSKKAASDQLDNCRALLILGQTCRQWKAAFQAEVDWQRQCWICEGRGMFEDWRFSFYQDPQRHIPSTPDGVQTEALSLSFRLMPLPGSVADGLQRQLIHYIGALTNLKSLSICGDYFTKYSQCWPAVVRQLAKLEELAVHSLPPVNLAA